MKATNKTVLANSTDAGNTGIYHLKTLWSRAVLGKPGTYKPANENDLDSLLIDILGLGLLPTYQYLYGQQPDFEAFEQWVTTHTVGGITPEKVKRCNALTEQQTTPEQTAEEDVLSPEDLAFWNEHGYVVIKQAVSAADCAASRKAILDFLQMEEQNAASWYSNGQDILQGIMVPLYRNAAIEKNRANPRIRRAYEQLWNRTGLVVTSDKCGFNPPETETFKYRGIGLHWDVSLATPIPFGTQGILYLTDTAANQGALTVVPGFHKNIENWLGALPANSQPRDTDFSTMEQLPIAAGAGDFIIWNHLLPHSSSPNRAGTPRIVQYFNWYDPMQKQQANWI